MNVLSLFSGIGGLELGLEWAGMQTVGQVEIDRYCQAVLAKHWPDTPRHDDVNTTPEWWASAPRPRVDLICGGFPCQGHSVAGRQKGTADERWGWPAFRNVVQAVEPPLVLIENVPNLTRTGLLDVLKNLASDGFDAWWFRVSAASVGAPHLRWRLFVIAAHPQRIVLRHEPGRRGGQDGEGTSVVGVDGTTWTLAHTQQIRRNGRTWRLAETNRWPEPPHGSLTVADTGSERRDRPQSSPTDRGLPPVRGETLSDTGNGRRPFIPDMESHWKAEPNVGRVANGIPNQMDRIKALGNAVVPRVAQYIGALILDAFQLDEEATA